MVGREHGRGLVERCQNYITGDEFSCQEVSPGIYEVASEVTMG